MKRQRGFTLIELVMVIVILGILAATLVPKFVDLTGSANTASDQASTAAVQTALATYLGKNGGAYPTVTELAQYVSINGAAATPSTSGNGISFSRNGTTVTVATYTVASCKPGSTPTATAAASDQVGCIGPASP